jgi:hypothetical protein
MARGCEQPLGELIEDRRLPDPPRTSDQHPSPDRLVEQIPAAGIEGETMKRRDRDGPVRPPGIEAMEDPEHILGLKQVHQITPR